MCAACVCGRWWRLVPGAGHGDVVPESARRVVDRAAQPARQRQVRRQRRQALGVVAGVVGELDGDGLGAALRHGAVQLVDGPLGLDTLVEPDEADALGEACRRARVASPTRGIVTRLKHTHGTATHTCPASRQRRPSPTTYSKPGSQ